VTAIHVRDVMACGEFEVDSIEKFTGTLLGTSGS